MARSLNRLTTFAHSEDCLSFVDEVDLNALIPGIPSAPVRHRGIAGVACGANLDLEHFGVFRKFGDVQNRGKGIHERKFYQKSLGFTIRLDGVEKTVEKTIFVHDNHLPSAVVIVPRGGGEEGSEGK